MILLALSDAVWLAVIGLITVVANSVTVIVTMVIKEVLDRERAKTVADKVEQVKTATTVATTEHGIKLDTVDAKLTEVVEKVEEVHKATNSMKDALVAATEKEALARGKIAGIEEEKEREK